MTRRTLALLLLVATVLLPATASSGCAQAGEEAGPNEDAGRGEDALAAAFEARQSGIQVAGSGRVIRILADDDDGDRHQRFILELSSGQTLLISHNIDVGSRVDGLRVGDTVTFHGVYEWNDRGGVVHWTHHDPDGVHESGWLEHDGVRHE